MPLKEADLKDTDTYKKASRMDMPKVAAGNAKFFVYKDVELPNSSGKKQKYPAFLALVDDNGIRKALTGKKLICKGTCGIKEERIAFEPATGKVPYKQLKVSVPLLLGKAVWIPAGLEDEAGEGEGSEAGGPVDGTIPTAPPLPPPPGPVDPLNAAWAKLTKDAQAYAAAHPERKEGLFHEMSAIADLLKANKAAEAKPRMDRVRALLDAPVAPPPPTVHPDAAAQVGARWSALVKELQAASTAHPEKKADLVRASAGIADMIRAGKLELAGKLMDTVDATLRGNPKELEYRNRYRAIEGKLAAALKNPAHDTSRLRAMDAFIVEKAGAGDFEAALKALQNLEEALQALAGGVPEREPERDRPTESENAGSDSEVSPVEFAKLRLRWQEAKKAVAGELSGLEKMVRSEMADDPMLGNLKRLAEILKVFNEGLSDALDNLANANTAEKRRAAAGAAQKAADHYMDHVVDDDLIEYVEDNPFTETQISGHLLPPLSAISAALGLMSHGS